MDKELYRTKYQEAPEEILDLMDSDATTKVIADLNQKYAITKQGARAYEVGCVLLGITHPKDFRERLGANLQISPEKSAELARDINRDIFANVKGQLMQIHNIQTPTGATGAKPTEAPAPPKPAVKKSAVTKPNVASPFSDSQQVVPKKKLPPAPIPPAGYNNTQPMSTPKPKNTFEAKLKRAANPKSAETLSAEVPKKPAEKLHTTVAKAPATKQTESTEQQPSQKAPATDPYREPLEQ